MRRLSCILWVISHCLIVFVACYLGFSLFVIGPYGSEKIWTIYLVPNSWSPDGQKFLFEARNNWSDDELLLLTGQPGVYVFDIQRHDFWILAYDTYGFDWSSDGDKIIYSRYGDSLYSVDVEAKQTNLLFVCPVYCSGPQWSPDEMKIVFRSDFRSDSYTGFNLNEKTFDNGIIHKPDWYGLNPNTTVDDALSEQYSSQFGPINDLSESPDGKWVAIETNDGIHILEQTHQKTFFHLNEKTFYRGFPFGFKSTQGIIILGLILGLEFLYIAQKIRWRTKQNHKKGGS